MRYTQILYQSFAPEFWFKYQKVVLSSGYSATVSYLSGRSSHKFAFFSNLNVFLNRSGTPLLIQAQITLFHVIKICHTSIIHINGGESINWWKCETKFYIKTTKLLTTFSLLTFKDVCKLNHQHKSFIFAMTGSLPCLIHQQHGLLLQKRSLRAAEFVSNKCIYKFSILV